MQFDAIQHLRRTGKPSHLRNDWVSPDLDRVIGDIVKQKVDAKRRSRASALFETLMREWEHYLEDKSEARGQYHYYSWKDAGPLPATWIANCASEPWLSSKSNRKVAPREIAIETASTKLTRGSHKSHFAYELSESDSDHPLLKALEIAGAPSTREIVDSLRALKNDQGNRARTIKALPFFVSLAAKIPRERATKIGEIDSEELRRIFEKEELLLTSLGWQSPSKAYRGRPIFGARRGVVSESKILDKLWNVLRIPGPTTRTCIEVLSEIGEEAATPDQATSAIMVDCFRWLSEAVDDFSAIEKRRLAKLPLWTSMGWRADRPIYVFVDFLAQNSIGDDVPIWQSNCSPQSLRSLPSAMGISIIYDEDFSVDPSLEVGRPDEEVVQIFRAATLRLKNELAKKGDPPFHSIDWPALEGIELFFAPDLRTNVKLQAKTYSVEKQVHVEPTTGIYFRHEDDLKEPDAGARILSRFSSKPVSEMVGYAWNYSWSQAESGSAPQALNLARGGTDDSADAIAAMLASGKGLKGNPLKSRKNNSVGKKGKKSVGPRPKPRELKSFAKATIRSIEITTETGSSKKKSTPRGPLITNPKKANEGRSSATRNSAIKNWTEPERERLGFEVLAAVLKGIDGSDLEDFSAIRRIGADSIDNLKRYFELKVYSGDAPDEVRFEASEFERAAREGSSYYLAIISGLEVGEKTEVRIFSDPVRTLPWRRVPRIRLGGIRSSPNALAISLNSD